MRVNASLLVGLIGSLFCATGLCHQLARQLDHQNFAPTHATGIATQLGAHGCLCGPGCDCDPCTCDRSVTENPEMTPAECPGQTPHRCPCGPGCLCEPCDCDGPIPTVRAIPLQRIVAPSGRKFIAPKSWPVEAAVAFFEAGKIAEEDDPPAGNLQPRKPKPDEALFPDLSPAIDRLGVKLAERVDQGVAKIEESAKGAYSLGFRDGALIAFAITVIVGLLLLAAIIGLFRQLLKAASLQAAQRTYPE